MSNTPILPELDQFTDQYVTPQMEQVLAERAENYFHERHPEFADFPPNAMQKLTEWCNTKCVCISLRNLEVAYYTLQADGSLQKDHDRLTVEAIEQFKEACPDWKLFQSKKNGDILESWLDNHGLEATTENLFKAFNFCVAHKLIRPTLEAQGIISTKNTIVIRDAVTAEDRQKFADKPYESDVARKKRDAELRRQAIAERVARKARK